jgi:acetolactate decarboxylase
MKYRGLIRFAMILLLSLALVGMLLAQDDEDTLFQVSTISALSLGIYDSDVPFAEVKSQGNFGLGTFHQLDGEMVALDGEFFQIRTDGVAYPVSDEMTTPFAAVTYFEADDTFDVDETLTCAEFQDALLAALPSPNIYYAIQVSGTFSQLQLRSVAAQTMPYVTLGEALENQVVFDHENIEATLVGFWLPSYLSELNATGFHFHAISADHSTGGHMLDCEVESVSVAIDYTDGLEVQLLDTTAFYEADLSE